MKTFIKYILLLAVMGSAKAQAAYNVLEEKSPFYPNETHFTTEILGLGEDFVYEHWIEYLQDHGGTSQVLENELGNFRMVTENVELPPLANEKVTIETLMTPNTAETGVDLSISIKKNDNTYLSSDNQNKIVVRNLKNWMLNFNRKLRTLEKDEVFSHEGVTERNINQ